MHKAAGILLIAAPLLLMLTGLALLVSGFRHLNDSSNESAFPTLLRFGNLLNISTKNGAYIALFLGFVFIVSGGAFAYKTYNTAVSILGIRSPRTPSPSASNPSPSPSAPASPPAPQVFKGGSSGPGRLPSSSTAASPTPPKPLPPASSPLGQGPRPPSGSPDAVMSASFVIEGTSAIHGFFRADDGIAYEARQSGPGKQTWGSWAAINGQPISSPITAARNKDGHLEVFALGADGPTSGHQYLYHAYQLNGTWTPWTRLWNRAVPSQNIPAVAMDGTGTLNLFVRDDDRTIYWSSETSPNSSSWGLFTQLSPSPSNSDPVVVLRNGLLDLFILSTTDNTVYENAQVTTGAWPGYIQVAPNPSGSKPIALVDGAGNINLVIRGTEGWAYVNTKSQGHWSGWNNLGQATFKAGPVAVVKPGGALDVYVIGNDGLLYRESQQAPGGSWPGGFTVTAGVVGGGLQSVVLSTSRSDGSPEVFAFGRDGLLYHVDWLPWGSWSDWDVAGAPASS
jgi:hypothetical protein